MIPGEMIVQDGDIVALHPEYTPYAGFEGSVGEAQKPFPQFWGVESHRLNGAS